jgi:hypothetical protein
MEPSPTNHNRAEVTPKTLSGRTPWRPSRTVRWIVSAMPLCVIGVHAIWRGDVGFGLVMTVAALMFYRWWEFRAR